MDTIEIFHDLTTVIRTTHQISAAEALGAINIEFENLTLFDQSNIFVIEKDRNINLIRLTNIGKELLPYEAQQEVTGQQERILIEVLGVDRPKQEDFLGFKEAIEN